MNSIISLELLFALVMYTSGVISGFWLKGRFK